jgi:alkyldihydroxyacetonephosphate synthase
VKRWNGWGDESIDYPLPEPARQFLEGLVGAGTPQPDVRLEEVIGRLPASRLARFGTGHPLVTVDAGERVRHARGQSLPDWIALRSGRLGAVPDGVAYPSNDVEVRTLLDYGRQAGVRLIPYGGGTSVVGHVNPLPGDQPVLTVDLGRLNELRRWDEKSGLATFGAGVAGPELEARLHERGHTLGHFPQSFEYSTLGGWIVTRSSGQQSLGYGRIEKLFAGGRLAAPVGTLELPPFPASAAGPDLRELVLGSEGRLGILTEATVRASLLPEQEVVHAVFLPDWDRALSTARAIMQARLPLSMLRVSTPVETQTTLALAGHERLINTLTRLLELRGIGPDRCMLLVGLAGRRALMRAACREVLDLARHVGRGVHVGQRFGHEWHKNRFRTPYLRNTQWDMGYAIDTLETATDWTAIPAMVEAADAALRGGLADVGERVHVFTHLSHLYAYGSSVYTTYLFRVAPDPDETFRRWQVLKTAASRAIVDHGGTISHQHGVGLDHRGYLPGEKGPLGMAALQDLAARFDPDGMMNPGKLLE